MLFECLNFFLGGGGGGWGEESLNYELIFHNQVLTLLSSPHILIYVTKHCYTTQVY